PPLEGGGALLDAVVHRAGVLHVHGRLCRGPGRTPPLEPRCPDGRGRRRRSLGVGHPLGRQIHLLQQGPVPHPPAGPRTGTGRPHRPSHVTFEWAAGALVPVDEQADAAARSLSDRLTKPRGALGAMEVLGARLAGMAGTSPPPVPTPAVV